MDYNIMNWVSGRIDNYMLFPLTFSYMTELLTGPLFIVVTSGRLTFDREV